jgi:predicted amidohydrolase YtcJ
LGSVFPILKKKGSLEVGKWADLFYDKDLMKIGESQILDMKPVNTYLKGQKSSKIGCNLS